MEWIKWKMEWMLGSSRDLARGFPKNRVLFVSPSIKLLLSGFGLKAYSL